MATAQQLKALIESYTEHNDDRFLSVASQIAAHAARAGKTKLADELRKLIEEKYTHPQEKQQRESDVTEATKELERAKKSTAARAAKSDASRKAKKAEWKLTSERLQKFRDQQAKCEMKAPQDGLVVYGSSIVRNVC